MIKKTIILAIAIMLSTATATFAQLKYSKNVYQTWPYLLQKFTEGTIHTNKGDFTVPVNICIANGAVHYTEKGVILEAKLSDVTSVEIGGETFVACGGRMCRVLAQKDGCYVVLDTGLSEHSEGVDIGFGMKSQTFAASDVSLASLANLGTQFLHAKMIDIEKEKEAGQPLSRTEKTYIKAPTKYVLALKKDFTDLVGKEASSSFLKSNKIKWSDPQDLLKVAEFIKSL